tara:strand:- start:2246 stop:2950 length:705 start_codon:yes stop_codon:yes gene_type:complete
MAVITSGKTFANGEQLSADKLNLVITGATFNQSDAVDGSTMTLIGGAMAVADNGITFSKLADVIDDDTMATASSTKLATSESIKEFVGVKQRTRVSSTTNRTITSVIPADDTTPLNSEGTQILSTTFTPTSTSNKIEVQFNGLLANNAAGEFTVIALFEDSTCVGAKWIRQASSGTAISSLQFQFTPSSTNAATYSLRVGPGATGTSFVNQDNAAAFTLGGLMEYSMTVLEVKS